jgi:hypothetical protein
MSLSLKPEAKMLLDAALNIGPFYSPENVTETVEILTGKERGVINEVWNELVNSGIVIQKDYHWSIDQARKEEIEKIIEEELEQAGITSDRVTSSIEEKIKTNPEKLSVYVKLLDEIYIQGSTRRVVFTDYDLNFDIQDLCEELLKERVAFRYSYSSRKKHFYRDFYLRVWPFDVEKIINEIVVKYLNVKGLNDEEWQVIFLLLLSHDLSHRYQTIKNNITFTDAELREYITNLKERGFVKEEYEIITLHQDKKAPLTQYFKSYIYPKMQSKVIEQFRKKIGSAISVLWLYTSAVRIYYMQGEERDEPISLKMINRTQVKEFEQYLTDIKKLGVLYDFEDKILLLKDIIRLIEDRLKGSFKESLIIIPEKDYNHAVSVFKDIFSKCQEYVKIQDPYLGKRTFDFLIDLDKGLKLQVLTSIKSGDEEDPKGISERIDQFKAERRGNFQIFFIGDRSTGDAPFHDRYILSKDSGWQVGTSLKDVGKGKETTILEISRNDKDQLVEPAFDRWWNANNRELESKDKVKIDYHEWKDRKLKSGETK